MQDLFNPVPLVLFQLLVSKETSQKRPALESFAVQTFPGGRGQSLWLRAPSVGLLSQWWLQAKPQPVTPTLNKLRHKVNSLWGGEELPAVAVAAQGTELAEEAAEKTSFSLLILEKHLQQDLNRAKSMPGRVAPVVLQCSEQLFA